MSFYPTRVQIPLQCKRHLDKNTLKMLPTHTKCSRSSRSLDQPAVMKFQLGS